MTRSKQPAPIQHFVGFTSLEGLAQVMDRRKPVYATATSEVISVPGAPMETRALAIVVSQIGGGGVVNMLKFPVGWIQYVNGTPWTRDADARQAEAIQVYRHVVAWLREQGFSKVLDALIAVPRDVVMSEGDIRFLQRDEATGRWTRTDKPEQPGKE